MSLAVIADTGPLVAYFDKSDSHHVWAKTQFKRITLPLLTCEPVLTETCFLLASGRIEPTIVLEAVSRGAIRFDFSIAAELDSVRRLMARYADIGASLADACLVRMSELHPSCEVMTIDRDFLIYRRQGRRIIPLIAPFER